MLPRRRLRATTIPLRHRRPISGSPFWLVLPRLMAGLLLVALNAVREFPKCSVSWPAHSENWTLTKTGWRSLSARPFIQLSTFNIQLGR